MSVGEIRRFSLPVIEYLRRPTLSSLQKIDDELQKCPLPRFPPDPTFCKPGRIDALIGCRKLNRVPLRMDFTEINSRGKRGELLGRIDRQNSRF
ncbi:hypothetical protein TNCV_1646541 [Trichonephila clavipes]|nr:hypothetical protein TNCV_1646541 [Trichonephila clavipes]